MSEKKVPVITLKSVSKRYNEYGVVVNALDNVSLEIFPGEFVSIIGPSGSGKSTLLHCMGLLDRPSSGKVYIENKDTSEISGKEIAIFRGKKLGFVFQNYNLIPRLTVLENVILPGLIMGKKYKEVEKRAVSLLKEVGIAHRSNHKSVHLSGGEQQRVAIARALINEPAIILADEPTGALDTKASIEIMNILARMNKTRKITIAFVSHDINIARFGRRIIVLRDGKIVCDTRKKDFFEKILDKINENIKGDNSECK